MLNTLKEKVNFDSLGGIIIGKPQNEVYYEEYKKILCKVVNNPDIPIVYNVNFGHAYPRCILPYGVNVEYRHSEKKFIFNEPLFSE